MDTQSQLQALKEMHDKGLLSSHVYEDHQRTLLQAGNLQTQLTHLEQYKMLREEVMQIIRTTDAVQYAAALSTAAIYTWLIINKDKVLSNWLWYVAPFLIMFCALKSADLTYRIWQIAKYLTRIEEASFAQDSPLPGWEKYKLGHKLARYDKIETAATFIFWLLLLVGSIVLSYHLSKSRINIATVVVLHGVRAHFVTVISRSSGENRSAGRTSIKDARDGT